MIIINLTICLFLLWLVGWLVGLLSGAVGCCTFFFALFLFELSSVLGVGSVQFSFVGSGCVWVGVIRRSGVAATRRFPPKLVRRSPARREVRSVVCEWPIAPSLSLFWVWVSRS